MSEPKTVEELLATGVRVLDDSTHLFDDHDHNDEAAELMSYVLDEDDMDDVPDDYVPPRRERERFLALVARRSAGEPLPFLTRRITIYGLELAVRPGAFVPRPSSELTIEEALKKAKRIKNPVIVDVATGQGPIALVLAHELPTATVYGADIDAGGLRQARANARELGLDNAHFHRGDMYQPLPKKLRGNVDLITGHVPYVPAHELEDLPTEVREYEPLYTLMDESGDDLGLMRRAVAESVEWLRPGGWLMLELAEDLTKKVERMCRKAGFGKITSFTDEDELSWLVTARMPKG